MKQRRVILWISLLLVLIAIASGIYLAQVHLRVHTDPAYVAKCDVSVTFKCSDVALSKYAVILGVPAAVWSLLGYAVFLFFIFWGLRTGACRLWPTGLYWLFNALTLAVSLTFAYIAEVIIGALCLGCMTMYGTNLLLFAGASWLLHHDRGALRRDLTELPSNRSVLAFAAVMTAVTGCLMLAYPRYWEQECLAPNGLPAGFDQDDSCWIGSSSAVLAITEFSDYRCPFCRKAHIEVRDLVTQYPDRIRLTHKHFPLDMACNPALGQQLHPGACLMARMAYCAGRQHQFWAMNDRLFELSGAAAADPAQVAADLGLDVPTFVACLDSSAAAAHVRKDIQEGLALGINATPTFVIDGKLFPGRIPEEVFRPVRAADEAPSESR